MSDLDTLGWKPFFQQQLFEYDDSLVPLRVIEVQRSGLKVAPELPGFAELPLGGRWFQLPVEERPTIGDWVLVDPDTGSIEVVLERFSAIKRRAPSYSVFS